MANTIYVFDKGYYDYNWWWEIKQKQAFFVTRLKENAAIEIVGERDAEGENILEDQIIRFKNKNQEGGKKNLYNEPLRRIVVKRDGNKKPLVIITNLLEFSAESISKLYKDRWVIELDLRSIKHTMRMDILRGKTPEMVHREIWTHVLA